MLRYEDVVIHTLHDLEEQVTLKAGSKLSELNINPKSSLNSEAIKFLSSFSTYLLRENPTTKNTPDLASYAFWIRKANLTRLINETRASTKTLEED